MILKVLQNITKIQYTLSLYFEIKLGAVLASSSPWKKTGFWRQGQSPHASVEQF